jgi:tetratricopeptide repeat protein 21B
LQGYRREHGREAGKLYKKAMTVDESSIDGLTGLILCQILVGQLEDAEQQLDFLQEVQVASPCPAHRAFVARPPAHAACACGFCVMQASIGKTSQLVYLRALMASKRNADAMAIVALVDEAAHLHLEAVKELKPSAEFFVKLDPDFVLDLARLYLMYCPSDPPSAGDAASPVLGKACKLLESLTKAVPGCVEGVYLLAKAKYLSGLNSAAQSGVQHCLNMNNTYADAHLLMAQVQLAQGNMSSAAQSLQTGLGYNFEVRELPLYHVINAQILAAEGKGGESLKALLAAMALPGVKRDVQVVQNAKKKARRAIPLGDRVSVFVALAEAYEATGRSDEAMKVLAEAKTAFEGTSEEVRVTIADAQLAVKRGEVENALHALKMVTSNLPYYVQAQEAMASIYLNSRKDKRLYAQCYKHLADTMPSVHTQMLLGDAYMNVQEPEKAIAVYQNASKQDPRNGALASKIGAALVKTHDYTKAVNYYEAAVKAGEVASLRKELAALYLKLRQPDKAERVLEAALNHEDTGDLAAMMQDVSYLQMQAQVYHETNRPLQVAEALTRARELQRRVLSQVTIQQPESVKEQQQLAAGQCTAKPPPRLRWWCACMRLRGCFCLSASLPLCLPRCLAACCCCCCC